MEDPSLLLSLFTILIILILLFKFLTQTHKIPINLPPSPPTLPYIGHLHLLKHPIHRALEKISQKYGPIISLKFGSQLVIVVSSSFHAEECFTKNDVAFANRPQFLMGKHIAYNFNTVVTAPYGERYRNPRKITFLEVFSTNRLNSSSGYRKDELLKMINAIFKNPRVDLSSIFRVFVFNSLLRMLAGKRYYGEGVENFEEAKRVTDIIREILENAGASYPGDFLGVYRWVDYGGYVKRIKRLAVKTDGFLQGLIDEKRRGVVDEDGEETVINRLILLQKSDPDYYTDDTIKGIMLVLIVAGTDTTSTTMEWTMSLLLNHPNVLNKVKHELDLQIGQDHILNEVDLPKLPYLQNTILESQRLYPAVPLLLPHLSSQECQVGGFSLPRGSMLLVNAWAIHRDTHIWDDPEAFRPERFESSSVDQYKFLPFGAGRRSCPGANLGNRLVGLGIGSLIQCFDWRRVSEEEVDMSEGMGLNMPRAKPLEALCEARPIVNKVF